MFTNSNCKMVLGLVIIGSIVNKRHLLHQKALGVGYNESIYVFEYLQCHIHQFFGGAGFLMSIARRKTVVQQGSLGGAVSPSQWVPGLKPQKILAILHSEQLKITDGEESFYQKSTLLRLWDPKPVYWLQNSSGYSTDLSYAECLLVLYKI